MVEEDEMFALVRHERLEVGAHDAVPSRPVLRLELTLRTHGSTDGQNDQSIAQTKIASKFKHK